MTAHSRLPQPLVESIRKALTRNALPGETHGLTREAEREAYVCGFVTLHSDGAAAGANHVNRDSR